MSSPGKGAPTPVADRSPLRHPLTLAFIGFLLLFWIAARIAETFLFTQRLDAVLATEEGDLLLLAEVGGLGDAESETARWQLVDGAGELRAEGEGEPVAARISGGLVDVVCRRGRVRRSLKAEEGASAPREAAFDDAVAVAAAWEGEDLLVVGRDAEDARPLILETLAGSLVRRPWPEPELEGLGGASGVLAGSPQWFLRSESAAGRVRLVATRRSPRDLSARTASRDLGEVRVRALTPIRRGSEAAFAVAVERDGRYGIELSRWSDEEPVLSAGAWHDLGAGRLEEAAPLLREGRPVGLALTSGDRVRIVEFLEGSSGSPDLSVRELEHSPESGGAARLLVLLLHGPAVLALGWGLVRRRRRGRPIPVVDLRIAALMRRGGAFAIDLVLAHALCAGAFALLGRGEAILLRPDALFPQGETPAAASLAAARLAARHGSFLATLFLVWLVVGAVAESRSGATPGKRLLGLAVRRLQGGRPGLAAALARRALATIDVFFLTAFFAVLSPLRQRLGDVVADTIVGDLRPAPPRIEEG